MIQIKKTTRYTLPDRLNDEDLAAALCMPGQKSPAVLGIFQILGDHIDDATELVANLKTAEKHGTLAHCAGGLDALRGLRDDLMQRITEATRGAK